MELTRTASPHSSFADPVCVVGTGAQTAVGTTAAMTAASVRTNLTRFRESEMLDVTGEPMLLSTAAFINEKLRGLDRLLALALPAAREALRPLLETGGHRSIPARIPVYLGTAASRPGSDAGSEWAVFSRLENELDLPISKTERHAIPDGHASSIAGLEQASRLITSGRRDFVLVGGVDSYYDVDCLEWLDDNKRLHSELNKDGFIPGEGAGFCLLTSVDVANRCGLEPLAVVRTVVRDSEPNPFTSDGVCVGAGLTRALHRALSTLGDDEEASWTLCDMNGESFRGMEWIYAYLRTGAKHADPLEIWHPADSYGDIGAASGVVLISIAVEAWQRAYARGPRCLVWTSSDGPSRSAVVLEDVDK